MSVIRPQRDGDETSVRAVTGRAFGRPQVVELVDLLATGPGRLALVAEDEHGAVVGHTMLSRGWIDAPARLAEVLILSPLSVDPPAQQRGIGGELVRAALASAEQLGAPALFLEGDPRYYSRFDFVAGATHGFAPPSARIPGAAFQVAVLPAWDESITGALVYPEAFWVLDCVGLREAAP